MSNLSDHRPPLRLGAREDFARAESLLRGEGFDEATICRAFNIEEMPDVCKITPDEADLSVFPERLALLIRLFLFTQTVPRFEVERTFDRAAVDSLLALDLLRATEFDAGLYYSPVLLYPVAGLLIASDRRTNPDGSPFTEPPDIVFPAINVGTLLFLSVISKSPARDALDLGSGSGVAAIRLSRHVGRAVAADITPRASHFARFNSMLNGRDNVEVVEGDLYEPVRGQMFDRIIAHPPYVPTLAEDEAVVYRDSGETGEVLTRRAVEGIPAHLRPGGTFYGVCMGHDTVEGNFEERARRWLGDAGDEFDVMFALGESTPLDKYVSDVVIATRGKRKMSIERLEQALLKAGTRELVYGALIIHRRAGNGRPWTARP
ncbi:MAG: methyltransferase, partial [Pyrinomonadaceae bacterium]